MVAAPITLYFAYGSNMHPEQMQERCPDARPVGIASLEGWEVRIGHRRVATIVSAQGSDVWGVLWTISPQEVATLDRCEGVHRDLYRPESVVVHTDDGDCTARTYIEDFVEDGPPRPGYLDRILDGARHFNLPEAYQLRLATLRG